MIFQFNIEQIIHNAFQGGCQLCFNLGIKNSEMTMLKPLLASVNKSTEESTF